MRHDPLFSSGELDQALREETRKLAAEVEAAPEEHLLRVDEDIWVAALVERWRVAAPELDIDAMWQDEPEAVQVDVSHDQMRAVSDRSQPAWYPGYRVAIHLPFKGDETVFKLRPSHFNHNPPLADVRKGELIKVIEYPHDSPRDIGAEARGLARSVGEFVEWARNDIKQFNGALEQTARSAIAARRARVQSHHEHVAATGLPVGPPKERGKTYISDVIVRRPAPVLPSLPDTAPMPLEPVLADEVFEHILSVIRSIGQDMERSPKAYDHMGEEDRRQTMLASLNTHYRGKTMAEAFNVGGKTDLLIRHDAQNIFIGECKIWSGAKEFAATIDQLFGYRAWRDTKLAVVMFVRERDLTSIVEKAREAVEQHPQFVSFAPTPHETELRCTVSWPGDERRHADLNVFFVHTASAAEQKRRAAS